MQPKSSNLFHFTRSIDHLKGIIQYGFMPRYSLEDAGPLEVDYVGYPMVCFCDIPILRISEHTAFYGEYGLGMTKEWGLRNGLAPLVYTPTTGRIPALANFLINYEIPDGPVDPRLQQIKMDLRNHFFTFIPMIKPITGRMLIGGNAVEKDFSQESEWRYVPPHEDVLFKNNFEAEKEQKNKLMEASALRFTPADVKYIFVKSDFEIPFLFDYIQANLAAFPLNDIKILISRIFSLETISRDL